MDTISRRSQKVLAGVLVITVLGTSAATVIVSHPKGEAKNSASAHSSSFSSVPRITLPTSIDPPVSLLVHPPRVAPTIVTPKPVVQQPKPVPAKRETKKLRSPVAAPAPTAKSSIQAVISFALSQQGKPYVWGATGPRAYDCSGLVMTAFARIGIHLPRTTRAMISRGTPISRAALQPGDLVWPAAGHVGIYLGGGKMIHSPQSGDVVKISAVYKFYAARRVA